MNVSFENTEIAFKSKSLNELRKSYLLFWAMNNNFLVKLGMSIIKFTLNKIPGVKKIVKETLFSQFCGGESILECEKVIDQLSRFKIGTVLDYSVEGENSEADFEKTKNEILETIKKASGNPDIPFAVFKVTGIGSAKILSKVQRKELLEAHEKIAYQKICNRVEKLCKFSFENEVKILIDAEETWIQNPIDSLAYEMMEKYNKGKAIVFNTFQMYRKDMLENLKKAFSEAERNGYILGAKLVRGAYMEKEREIAQAKSFPSPIQDTKNDSDNDFDESLRFCIKNIKKINICSGTHNEKSNYLLIDQMKEYGLSKDDPRIYFVQLYGMSDPISYNLSNAGYNVGKYVPYGPVESVMPYLFRRANENTSISGQTSREFNLIQKEIRRRRKDVRKKT